MANFKFKKIPCNYFKVLLDRLFRLEPAMVRYERVLGDIINKFSIGTKFKQLSFEDKTSFATEIFNSSLEGIVQKSFDINYDNQTGISINKIIVENLKKIENNYFLNSIEGEKYLDIDFDYYSAILSVYPTKLKNVDWLYELVKNINKNPYELRKSKNLLYPVSKILLCEGETENILLEPIFSHLGFDFSSNGILVIPSGGKNRLARKYYKLIEYLKLPVFILLDYDAIQIKKLIEKKLRKPDIFNNGCTDKIYIINSGEFEDIMPIKLMVDTINYFHNNELNCSENDFCEGLKTVENLKNIFKYKGFGEYKKAVFAKNLKEYIESNPSQNVDFSESEVVEILENLK